MKKLILFYISVLSIIHSAEYPALLPKYNLIYEDGTAEKFQGASWKEKLQNEKFRNRELQIMDEEIIMRFDKKEGPAEDFYDIDPEQ